MYICKYPFHRCKNFYPDVLQNSRKTENSSQLHIVFTKVLLKNGWNSKQMITEGEAAIPLETTLHAFRNQEKTKQRSTIVRHYNGKTYIFYSEMNPTFKNLNL